VALVAVGCTVSLKIPDQAVIRCDRSADCPKKQVCHDVRHECVPRGELDLDPPAVFGDATVTPDIGEVGTRFFVTFSVDDTLGKMPEVSFNLAGEVRLLDPPTTTPTSAEYVYTYTAIGDELEGANPLRVTLEDTGGNVTSAALGVALVFEFTSPDVIAPASVRLLPDPTDNPLREVDMATFGTLTPLGFPPRIPGCATTSSSSTSAAAERAHTSSPLPASERPTQRHSRLACRLLHDRSL
jgi:hypothetical protein